MNRTSADSRDPYLRIGRSRHADAITDCIACGVAGSATGLAGPLHRVVSTASPHDSGAALWCAGGRSSTHDAALYNGAIAHALDDLDLSGRGHAR